MGGGEDQQGLGALTEGLIQPCRGGAEGGNAGNDLYGIAPGAHPLMDVHIGRIDAGVSQSEKDRLFSLVQEPGDGIRRLLKGPVQGTLIPDHGGGDLPDFLALHIFPGNGQGHIVGPAAVRHQDHIRLGNDPDGLQGQQLRVPRAYAHTPEFAVGFLFHNQNLSRI